MSPLIIRQFRLKLTIILIFGMLFVLLLSDLIVYKFALEEQFQNLRRQLMMTAQTAALIVDPAALQKIPLNAGGLQTPAFQSIRQQLIKIKLANPLVKYLYTMTPTNSPGIWQFIVDANPFPEKNDGRFYRAFPGDTYNAARFPEMMKALHEPAADQKLEIDEWGVTLSGYAPIRDQNGRTVAMLGVDIDAKDVYSLHQRIHNRMVLVIISGVLLSFAIGFLFSKKIHEPIRQLVEGIRYIGKGHLKYQIDVKGHDEISELGHSFNHMAKNLHLARERLIRYFYSVVRTLIKVLEAKDRYTKGHSEKVAYYAAKIAMKMGFSREQIKLFRKMTLLHDIGKVGVKDSVLNKPDKLTPEEWEMIKKHPEIGEEILKPVLDNPDMLAIVRGHHERYDGKGYPDGLSKDQINIYAAIVAVADAYDAMTTDRAYRKALSKSDAIRQLKENRGTQFHPQVVDAFIEILEGRGTPGEPPAAKA